jgi:uncharacterized glyoxalase superfamily protein PhnB
MLAQEGIAMTTDAFQHELADEPDASAARRHASVGGRMQLLVNVDVPALEPALSFYTQAFGLRVGRRFAGWGVELLGAQAAIYVLVKAEGTAAHAAGEPRRYQRHWTPVHVDLVVDALEPAVARALAAGARAEGDVRTDVWGRIVQLADPFGHGWCLIEFSPRGYDAIADPD